MEKLRYILLLVIFVVNGPLFANTSLEVPPCGDGIAQNDLPPFFTLSAGEELENQLDDYTWDLGQFFEYQGKRTDVAFGVAKLRISNPNSSEYFTAIDLAYRNALVQAYLKIAQSKSRAGVFASETSDERETEGSPNVRHEQLISQCQEEADAAYARHQAELEEAERQRNSFWSLVKERLKSDERRAQEMEEQRLSAQEQGDFIHTCKYEVSGAQDTIQRNMAVVDVLSGGRVWQTVLHEDQIGVILVLNEDTSEVAYFLKNQLPPAQACRSAVFEVRNRIEKELQQQQGGLDGVIGARMMKLSNGEWAVYSYGTGQVQTSTSVAREAATVASATELSRFAELMVNNEPVINLVGETKTDLIIEVNVTQGTHAPPIPDPGSTIGRVVERANRAETSITLYGSENIITKKLKEQDSEFYLSATAWSPSIMAANMDDRDAFDNAGPEAALRKKGDKEEAPKASKVRLLNRDW
jgi:hypothetical protein